MKTTLFSALMTGSLLIIPSTLVAQDDTEIIVTATRTAQTADETLTPVTVITREEITRTQATSVQDLIAGRPGIAISNNGGAGKLTTVFMRGTESDHVLFMIDGVKVGSATSGLTAIADLPIEQIERIEIVRGPRSSLYGSEAIGGVIQIFTRKGDGKTRGNFLVRAGRYDSLEVNAGVTAGSQQSWFNASVGASDTQGFNACRSDFTSGCFTSEPDKDGYENLNVKLGGGLQLEGDAKLSFNALLTRADVEFDGGFQNESDNRQQVLGMQYERPVRDDWFTRISVGVSEDENDNFKDAVFSTRFDTRRTSVSWQNDFTLSQAQLLTAGIDYQKDKVDSSLAFDQTERDNTAGFVQYQHDLGRHNLEFSLRGDDNEQYGRHTTGSLAWGSAINDKLRLIASYGTAFKAPDFNDLYFPGFGNPNLQPEESRSLELGLRGKVAWGRWGVSLFRTDVDELIAFDPFTFAPVNINEARIVGMELEAGTTLLGWETQASLTLLDTENRTSDANNGNELPRRSPVTFRLDVDKNLKDWRLGATLLAEDQRYDDLGNNRPLGGYATLDVRAAYDLSKTWQAQARIKNLFDKQYETAEFYNQEDRSVVFTLRYRPQ